MVKYGIYFAAAALIIWSVFYVIRNIYRQWKGKCGCGECGSCLRDCPGRKKQK